MHANVYLDPTDAAIDHDIAAHHFHEQLARLTGRTAASLPDIEVEIRPDARFVGRRPILVITGGAA